MLLKDKFPHLEKYYSLENPIEFSDAHYQSTEKLLWNNCDKNHFMYKTALEFQRYSQCQSCFFIEKHDIKYEETLAYLYPEVAELMENINIYSPDSIRPDSKYKAFWKDTEERLPVFKRVSQYKESLGYHNGKNAISHNSSLPLFREEFPEYHSWLKYDINLTIGSSRKVQWECPQGHQFESSVRDFIKRTHKCVVCSGIVCVQDINDMTTTHPYIASYIVNPDPSTITSSYSGDVEFHCQKCDFTWLSQLPRKRIHNERKSFNCPSCYGKVVNKGFNDLLTLMPQIQKYWNENNEFSPDEVTVGSEKTVLINCSEQDCDNIIYTYPYVLSRTINKTHFICSSCQGSSGEKEIASLIESWGIVPVLHDRLILQGKELDIYIPEKKIAIEYNGVYWHSNSTNKDKMYHYNKWKKCHEKEIQLITIWEDDWRDKRDLVEKMLEYKLGLYQQEKIFARSTQTATLTEKEAKVFLDENHIQGHVKGCKHYGLMYHNDIVAILSVKKTKNEMIIDRYATSSSVVGGFTKLLSYAVKNNPGIEKVVTFSDHTVSNGDLYSKNGFVIDKELPPDYMYVYKQSRYHKSNFRKSRFRDDDSLLYEPHMTETELAKLNGIPWIWDAGKTRWVLEIP